MLKKLKINRPSLDASNCIECLQGAIAKYGAPEIINSDQGCQFTCKEWEAECSKYTEMKVSMDQGINRKVPSKLYLSEAA